MKNEVNNILCNSKYFLFLIIFLNFIQTIKTFKKFKIYNNNNFTSSIVKQKNDNRNFYNYKLSNGLEVFIIEDKNTISDGISLSVSTGSAMDEDILGLAHFTEHMLFLGSKKYPNATYFIDFITQHQGNFNGFTNINKTSFYFTIDHNFLNKALDIFSSVFIDPLFNQDFIDKEINSVNSEFEKNLHLDSYRKDHILRTFANLDSFYHKFRTGNIKTLKNYTNFNNINLTEKVREYFDKFYTPEKMKLIIYTSCNYNFNSNCNYKKLIEKTFGKIPKNNKIIFPIEKKKPFEQFNQGFMILYETLKNHKEFEINFIIPNVYKDYPNNPTLFIKSIINNKSKNSLFDILRSKGYITYIKSNLKEIYNSLFFFKLSGNITQKGIENLHEILKIIMNYLDFIKININGDINNVKTIYNEAKDYFSNKFINSFKKQKNVMNEINLLSFDVWKYPKDYLIAKHKLLDDFDLKNLNKFMSYLSFNNSIILIGDKTFKNVNFKMKSVFNLNEINKNKINFDKLEPYSNVPFTNFTLNQTILNEVKIDKINFVFNHDLNLNKTFIENENKLNTTNNKINYSNPKILINNFNLKVFYKNENIKNKINIYLQFIFPNDINDIKYSTFLRFLVYSINHKLKDFFINANKLKNSFRLMALPTGILLKVYSNINTINQTLENLLIKIKKIFLTQIEFNLIKEEFKNQFEGINQVLPKMKAFINFFSLIRQNNISTKQILEELNNFTIKKFKENFEKLIFKNLFCKILIHGDINENKANNLIIVIKNNLNLKDNVKIVKKNLNYKNHHADLDGSYIYREKYTNKYNKDHAIINFYQIGTDSLENLIKSIMIKEMVGDVYFTELRIKQQLGYSANARIFSESEILYYMIVVEGSKETPDKMDQKIENVISIMKQSIENYSQEKVEELIKIIIRTFLDKYKSFKLRTEYIWNEICKNKNLGNFNLKKILFKIGKSINKKEIVNFFNKLFYTNLHKISIQEFSNNIINLPKNISNIKRDEIKMKYIPHLIVENDINYFRKNIIKFYKNK